MAVCANELLASANDIKSKCNATEADFRSAISRAYYACYHAADDFHVKLSQQGITKANCGVHENLVHQLNHPTLPHTDPNNQKSKLISHFLKGQLFNRRMVDYDLRNTVTPNNVEVVFANTIQIFKII